MINEDSIFELLKLSGVPPEKARQRSVWLTEDLVWIDFDVFQCTPANSPFRDPQTGQVVPVVEYEFGTTQFSVNNAENLEDKRSIAIGGAGLNRGSLRWFSIVSELGRKLLPNHWLKCKKLRNALRSPAQHLDTLNEVWWLGRFPAAVDVMPCFQMMPPKDIDWRFRLSGSDTWINIEVKNRPGDISRHVHGLTKTADYLFSKIDGKFAPSPTNEVNFVALSLCGAISRDVQLCTSEWLSNQNEVDGVLIWSTESRNSRPFDSQNRVAKAKAVSSSAIREPEEELEMFMVYEVVHWPREILGEPPPGL
ncbi:MAG: hypothetical protein B7Z37_00090 [Verrucomicrobia bacterium 12-59-8]|nr:MAG: hypothetical protein B7Z37_00090 [Verrucomicrobia bacterium 12-59-8]